MGSETGEDSGNGDDHLHRNRSGLSSSTASVFHVLRCFPFVWREFERDATRSTPTGLTQNNGVDEEPKLVAVE